ncbi:MAG: hypothetical protein ACH350_05075 [Parachlamydiaceae bacterium]
MQISSIIPRLSSFCPHTSPPLRSLHKIANPSLAPSSSTRAYSSFRQEQNLFSSKKSDELTAKLNEIVAQHFAIHPFVNGVTQDNAKNVLKGYFAMSQAFPYLQAGAYKDIIISSILKNQPISKEIDESFVVGTFLSFDETGGNYLLRTEGIQALPKLLNTEDLFHASLLSKDMQAIFGENIQPNYEYPTNDYLLTLLNGLGSQDRIERCATMVAFEMHAGQMIEALWNALHSLYPHHAKDSLQYFQVHVGGDDPQEEYHKMLTQKMVDSAISFEKKRVFLEAFKEKYENNFSWCATLCDVNRDK